MKVLSIRIIKEKK